MENTPNAGDTTGSADSNAATYMAELMQKLGGPEEAMKAFALFTTMMEKAIPAASTSTTTTAPPPPQVPEVAKPHPDAVHAVTEPFTSASEADVAEKCGQEADLAAGLELLAVGEPRLASADVSEGVTPVISAVGESAGETPVVLSADISEKVTGKGETPVVLSADISEKVAGGETSVAIVSVATDSEGVTPDGKKEKGETPVGILEGVTPVENLGGETPVGEDTVDKGETPVKAVGTEAQNDQDLAGVETPVYIAGATPMLSKEGEALVGPRREGLIW